MGARFPSNRSLALTCMNTPPVPGSDRFSRKQSQKGNRAYGQESPPETQSGEGFSRNRALRALRALPPVPGRRAAGGPRRTAPLLMALCDYPGPGWMDSTTCYDESEHMTNRNKAKGTAWETEIVTVLREDGVDTARRVVQAGAADVGDV